MLSSASAEVVRATLPVIGGAINDITPIFYKRMFAAHPELIQNLFNRGNQAQGDQQRALAGSIAAYATLLVGEDGPAPEAVLDRIAHKHASLGIVEDQYPIVHEHLFAAIVEVLGDAVTPEIAAAWDEVYWHMAHALIDAEKKLYADTGVADGDVFRTLVVRGRTLTSPDTVSLVLTTPDGSPLPKQHAGQYVSVAVNLPDGAHQIRQYSLTHATDDNTVTIAVKAVAGTEGDPAGEVSNFLHDNVFEGDELEVSAPFGELSLADDDKPVVLISAGIGITPMVCFLSQLRDSDPNREVVVLHADRSPARQALRTEMESLVAKLPGASLYRWYENTGARETGDHLQAGLIDLDGIDLPAEANYYLCGPTPFMETVNRSLLGRGITEDRIHYEIFGPSRTLAA